MNEKYRVLIYLSASSLIGDFAENIFHQKAGFVFSAPFRFGCKSRVKYLFLKSWQLFRIISV